MPVSTWTWIGFNALILGMLALDLGVFHRREHAVGTKEALAWTIVWITLSVLFGVGVYIWMGPEPGLMFFTGYLIEKSLSVDNIFVFVLIFSFFNVPAAYQHRVLFWGVLGALVMRAALIAVGATLLHHFHWIIYVFGGFLLLTGFRLLTHKDEMVEPDQNPVVRLVRKVLPVSDSYEGAHFFVRKAGKLIATPLFIVLVIVESTDLIFAVDSIPAIFAVTTDTFLVYTSNALAILGLRALYFLLAGVIGKFRFLKPALSAILVFIGIKMLLAEVYPIPTAVSLSVVVGLLFGAVLLSSLVPAKRTAEH